MFPQKQGCQRRGSFKHSGVATLPFFCSGSAVKCHDSTGNQDAPEQAHAGFESVGKTTSLLTAH